MKYLKLFENFEEYKGLPSDQEEDLNEIFQEFISLKQFTPEQAWQYFQPDSQTFANFLIQLENETDWFDYTQMDQVFQEISIYIEDMKDDGNEIEWEDEEGPEYNEKFKYP